MAPLHTLYLLLLTPVSMTLGESYLGDLEAVEAFNSLINGEYYSICANESEPDIELFPPMTGLNTSMTVNIPCAQDAILSLFNTTQGTTKERDEMEKMLQSIDFLQESSINMFTRGPFYNYCLNRSTALDYTLSKYNIEVDLTCVRSTVRFLQLDGYYMAWFLFDEEYHQCVEQMKPEGVIHPSFSGFREPLIINLWCIQRQIQTYKFAFGEELDSIERVILHGTFPLIQGKATFLLSATNDEYMKCIEEKGPEIEIYIQELGNITFIMNYDCRNIILKSVKDLYKITEDMRYAYIVTDIFGIIGNILVIFIFARYRDMRTIPNMYVMLLAAADLILIIKVFPYPSYIQTSQPYKIFDDALEFVFYACPYILIAMSIDRYISIRKCVKMSVTSSETTRKRNTAIACFVTAVSVALFFGMQFYIMRGLKEDIQIRAIVLIAYVINFRFLIPLFIIAVVNTLTSRLLIQTARNVPGENQAQQSEARTRAAKILLALILNFVFSYALVYATFAIIVCLKYNILVLTRDGMLVSTIMNTIGYLMYGFHSCVNPIVLYFNSPAWKKYFSRIFCPPCCAKIRKLGRTK